MKTIDDLNCIVYSYYCSPQLFWENVGYDKAKVLNKLKTIETDKELRKLVNEYI